MMTKSRYPVAKRGVSSLSALPFAIPGGLYRTAPNPIADDAKSKKKKRQDDEEEEHGKLVMKARGRRRRQSRRRRSRSARLQPSRRR